MHPLVAVAEPENLAWRPKGEPFGQPQEADGLPRGALGGIGDDLPEGQKGLRHLQDDQALPEVGQGGQVGPVAVPEGLHDDPISLGLGQPAEVPADCFRR